MAKKKDVIPVTSKELKNLQKHEISYKIQSMDLEIDERKTKLLFKKATYVVLSISAFTSLLGYISNIPIPPEIIFGIPISAIHTTEIPKKLLNVFKKPPP